MFRTDEDFDDFAEFVRHSARYILGRREKEFIDAVLLTSKKRIATMPPGQVLWRAALGYSAEKGVSPYDLFFWNPKIRTRLSE